jgi:hypothetical protein
MTRPTVRRTGARDRVGCCTCLSFAPRCAKHWNRYASVIQYAWVGRGGVDARGGREERQRRLGAGSARGRVARFVDGVASRDASTASLSRKNIASRRASRRRRPGGSARAPGRRSTASSRRRRRRWSRPSRLAAPRADAPARTRAFARVWRDATRDARVRGSGRLLCTPPLAPIEGPRRATSAAHPRALGVGARRAPDAPRERRVAGRVKRARTARREVRRARLVPGRSAAHRTRIGVRLAPRHRRRDRAAVSRSFG